MDNNNQRSTLEPENAKFGLIDKIVERAVNRPSLADKESYYSKQVPKAGKLTLDEVLDQILRNNGNPNDPSSHHPGSIGLRSLENVDLDALLRGFEAEEVKEGKLVLYITEKQLLQLLKQRAVIVPTITNTDSISKRNKTPVNIETSVGYRPTNPIGSLFENSQQKPGATNEDLSTDVYRTTNSLSSIVEEDRRTNNTGSLSKEDHHSLGPSSVKAEIQSQSVYRSINSLGSEPGSDRRSVKDENAYRPLEPLTIAEENRSGTVNEAFKFETAIDHSKTLSQQQKLSSSSNHNTTVEHHDQIVLNELEKFVKRLQANLKNDHVDWSGVRAEYTNQPDRPELMKKYVVSLLDDRTRTLTNRFKSSRTQPSNEEEKLKAVDEFVDNVINRKKQKESDRSLKILDGLLDRLLDRKHADLNISEIEAINVVEALVQRLKVSSRQLSANKIIIRTTRKLPAKVYITDGKNFVKKKITYSYLDNYQPTTRVYEVANNTVFNEKNVAQTADLFNSKNSLNYLIKPFDTTIADSIGKPSHEQINKYLSVVNTGVKNSDLIQIHPLLNNKTEIKTKSGPDTSTTYPSLKEPILIDSNDYPKYIQDIATHFGGLQVTDFPLYVQGLEFRQNPSSSSKVSQSVVLTKNVKPATEGIQNSETISRQIVNNINNVQYVRINNNSTTPSVVAH